MTPCIRTLLLAAGAGLSVSAGVARAEDPPPEHSFTGKGALYSEYEYRGISQTSEKPALQLNLDYAHSSGIYVGTFLSNIKWLKDTASLLGESTNAALEWDIYGGYKWEFVKDWTLDVGYLRYEYPNSKAFPPATVKPNTDEAYIGVSYGPATLKYSYAFSTLFGVPNSKGSDYIELAINQPIVDKVTLNGTLGYQRYTGHQTLAGGVEFNNDNFSYGVWKIGATYDFGKGFNAGAYVKGTNADAAFYTYNGKDWSKTRLVAFVNYSF
jgi:uncharacterized protein (TIGR02001 family)